VRKRLAEGGETGALVESNSSGISRSRIWRDREGVDDIMPKNREGRQSKAKPEISAEGFHTSAG